MRDCLRGLLIFLGSWVKPMGDNTLALSYPLEFCPRWDCWFSFPLRWFYRRWNECFWEFRWVSGTSGRWWMYRIRTLHLDELDNAMFAGLYAWYDLKVCAYVWRRTLESCAEGNLFGGSPRPTGCRTSASGSPITPPPRPEQALIRSRPFKKDKLPHDHPEINIPGQDFENPKIKPRRIESQYHPIRQGKIPTAKINGTAIPGRYWKP